jgi:hypothetical protein
VLCQTANPLHDADMVGVAPKHLPQAIPTASNSNL